jgi:hypothetical protein
MNTISAILDFDHPIWQGGLLALLLGITLFIAWPPLKKILAHRYLQGLIGRLGRASFRHISLMDGADVPIYLEYLILQPDGLLLLSVKPFRGNIFAAEKIQNWTQVVRHHSFKFANPLHEMELNIQALRGMLPKIDIRGLVVFAQGAHFPKGKPTTVCDFNELKAIAAKSDTREIPAALQQAWEHLGANIRPNKKLYPAVLYQKGDKRRLLLGFVMLILCLVYIARVMGWLKGFV